MIGLIEGELIPYDDGIWVVKLGNGLGHQVHYRGQLNAGPERQLWVSQIIREMEHSLYAFDQKEEKKLFELLLKVKGVGPRSAFSLVMAMGVSSIVAAVAREDQKPLSQTPGIGKKTAAQIVLDLKNKLDQMEFKVTTPISRKSSNQQLDLQQSPVEEEQNSFNSPQMRLVLDALKELGHSEKEVYSLVVKIWNDFPTSGPSEIIPKALQQLYQN